MTSTTIIYVYRESPHPWKKGALVLYLRFCRILSYSEKIIWFIGLVHTSNGIGNGVRVGFIIKEHLFSFL